MSLDTPTTQEVSDNIVAQIETSIGQTVPLLPKTFIRVLAKALAGVFVLLYKYAGYSSLQTFVKTASIAETEINGQLVSPLIEWGRLIGVGDPAAATQAELVARITVTVQSGTLPVNSQLVSSAGVTYITLSAVTLDAATKDVTIRAVSDQSGGSGAGTIGNLQPGDTVNFSSPLANVETAAEIVSQSVTGADGETEAAYRQRVLDRFQKRPQGGAYADYEIWGEEPAGIINVYPYASSCPGQVDLYVEATPESSGSPDGIPTAAQLQEVLDSVELDQDGLATRRPVTALVNALPIVRVEFAVEVIGVVVEDLATVEASISTAIDEYFQQREPFIPGLSVPPRRDRITRSGIGGVVDDVVSAAAGVFSNVMLKLDGQSLEIYTLGEGEKAKASITFL